MPATPPPPPPPLLPSAEVGPITPPPPSAPPLPSAGVVVSGTPPTSPQRIQHAARHQERNQRLMGSPEQRRTPTAPAPLPLPTFNRQIYSHLSADLAAQVAALPPLIPLRRTISHAQPAAVPPISIPLPCSISAVPDQILSTAQLAAAYAALPPLHSRFNRVQTSSVSFEYLFLSI